jgi:nucleoside-diphosphate-sugar epimerase
MAGKKIIAVVGATGAQGGGLVRAILADPAGPFTAPALTRDADSEQARELASHGVEVVEADLDDETSLRKAFDRAYGAYVVTNFWAHRTPEQERTRSRAQMELDQAAAAATVSIAGTHATGEELASKFTAALGEKVVYRPITTDQMRAPGQPLEIANTFQFYSDASEYFTAVRDLDLVRELNPELQSLDSWLAQHKSEIPVD